MKRLELGARPAPFFPLLPFPLLGDFDLLNITFELAAGADPRSSMSRGLHGPPCHVALFSLPGNAGSAVAAIY